VGWPKGPPSGEIGNVHLKNKKEEIMSRIITLAAPILAVISFGMIILGFSRVGLKKQYRYIFFAVTFITACAYALQVVFKIYWFAPFGTAIWLFLAILALTGSQRKENKGGRKNGINAN
jgi:hypothetical protein